MRHTFCSPLIVAGAVAALIGCSSVASAVTITLGDTFAVASENGEHGTGTHFHSSSGGVFGNPAGKAEVGTFFDEEVAGLSEFNLSGLTAGPAFVTFNVFKSGGLFNPTNNFPFNGAIDLVAYQGNNHEDISDYNAPSIGNVHSISTAWLVTGHVVSFDITSLFAAELSGGFTSLGIRLMESGDPRGSSGAWTFDNFRLTTTDETTGGAPVPEPGTLMLLGSALLGFAYRQRQRFATHE